MINNHGGATKRDHYLFAAIMLMCLVLSATCQPVTAKKYSVHPASGPVPDAKTAIAIAKAVWIPIYGKRQIQTERPYIASIKDGVWTVIGSVHHTPSGIPGMRRIYVGGVAIIEIAQRDGKILRVSHGV